MAIVTNWKGVLKAKKETQQELTDWTNEDWGSQKQHKAKAKGKTPPAKAKGRYMPKSKFQSTKQGTLNYQDQKKKEGRKKGQQHVPTGKKFTQKSKGRGFTR